MGGADAAHAGGCSAGTWWFWLMALASATTCCWVATRSCRSSALAVDMDSFMAGIFALLAMFIWAMEFVIDPRLSPLLRAAAAP